jgi:hypothetical protein
MELWTFGSVTMNIIYGTMSIDYKILKKLVEMWTFNSGTTSIIYGAS